MIRIRAYNAAYCAQCFTKFFIERIKRTIEKFKLFDHDTKILVAVSGGKDSLTIWEILARFGYDCEGLFIDLGIEDYSQASEMKVKRFAEERELKFSVLRVSGMLNYGIRKIAKEIRRPTCSICGLVKRYLMNYHGLKGGFDVIVTGHNLDDEAATLFGNLINWQTGYLSRQAPRLDGFKGLVARAKPLVLISERESAAYAFLNRIDYHVGECPYSRGATSIFYKRILNEIEAEQPAAKLRFYKGFLRNWKRELAPATLESCTECGYPTTAGLCSFCRLAHKLKEQQR